MTTWKPTPRLCHYQPGAVVKLKNEGTDRRFKVGGVGVLGMIELYWKGQVAVWACASHEVIG